MNELALKYGCNPNQKPSRIYMEDGSDLPVTVLNGKPGYINFLDALNSIQLVKELKAACGLPAPHSPKSQQRTGSRRRCARRPFGGFSPLLPLSGHSHFPPQGRGEAKRKAPPGPAPINRGAPLVFQGSPKTIRKEKENYFLGIKPFWFTQYLGSLPSSITWQISR